MKNREIELLKGSIIKLEYILDEIGIELEAVRCKHDSYELNELCSKYDKLSKKASKLRNKTNKLMQNIEKDEKLSKSSCITYDKNVEFSEIKNVNIDNNVGKLPVNAVITKKSVCDVKLLVLDDAKFVIKKKSIICKSSASKINKITSKETRDIRNKINSKNNTNSKIILSEDVAVSGIKQLLEVVYGRPVTNKDYASDIRVGKVSLNDYLKTGVKN